MGTVTQLHPTTELHQETWDFITAMVDDGADKPRVLDVLGPAPVFFGALLVELAARFADYQKAK